jgi:regulation of enolase protein 1 (concanavalin A-like superfamily)
LEIVGSKGTDHWEGKYSAPLIIYPTKENFEAQVKMLFDPISNIQAAGLGVRSSVESNTFIRIALGLDPSYGGKRVSVGANTKGVGERLGSSVYTDEIIWMKIKRQDDVITLSYSRNGQTWTSVVENYVFAMPTESEVFLYTFSVFNDQSTKARFYDFTVSSLK